MQLVSNNRELDTANCSIWDIFCVFTVSTVLHRIIYINNANNATAVQYIVVVFAVLTWKNRIFNRVEHGNENLYLGMDCHE